MKPVYSLFLLFLTFSAHVGSTQTFDLQGHRGCRGLMPENSMQGFLKAIDIGVTTLEMDVVISADGKVIVSHDLYISSQFCVNELGTEIPKKEDKKIVIFQLDYEDVKLFDCGIKGNEDFPEQKKISTIKPLLSEVISQCEDYVKEKNLPAIHYNIEIKSSPDGDLIRHPVPELFTQLVYNVLHGEVPTDRVTIQSFDLRILRLWKMKYPEYALSLLIGNSKTWSKNVEELGFEPDIYSPNYKLISGKDVQELHAKSIKVIPWTVNDIKEMGKVRNLGVDGLITDYPNRYFENFPSK